MLILQTLVILLVIHSPVYAENCAEPVRISSADIHKIVNQGFFNDGHASECLCKKVCHNDSCLLDLQAIKECLSEDTYANLITYDDSAAPTDSVVSGYIFDRVKKAGYIRIRQFGWHTSEETAQVLSSLVHDLPELSTIVLDLRNNIGGYVAIVNEVLDQFSPQENIFMYEIRPKDGSEHETSVYHTKKMSRFKNIRLVVLVNRYTASAAEIATGVLQRWGHTVLGELTHGKGISQSRFSAGGCYFLLTTGMIFFPDGTSYHGKGMLPNVFFETTDINLSAVLKAATENKERQNFSSSTLP